MNDPFGAAVRDWAAALAATAGWRFEQARPDGPRYLAWFRLGGQGRRP